MTGPVTPAAIASVIQSQAISRDEAATLIQHYADEYAAMKVEEAVHRFDMKLRAVLEAPTAGMSS